LGEAIELAGHLPEQARRFALGQGVGMFGEEMGRLARALELHEDASGGEVRFHTFTSGNGKSPSFLF
jgi:hypothetical protein